MSARRADLDVARAIAILGMFIVHAGVVLAPLEARGVAATVFAACDGRAAATFLVVAGMGAAQLAARLPVAALNVVLGRRAALLFTLGMLNLVVWPGDILRAYGLAFAVTPWLVAASDRRLSWISAALLTSSLPVTFLVDWDARWSWDTLSYRDLWTAAGLARHLLLDGFRAALPWLGFYVLGLRLGRIIPARWPSFAAIGSPLLVAAAAASFALRAVLSRGLPTAEREALDAAFGLSSLPPNPLFVASSVGAALVVLGGSAAAARAGGAVVAWLAAAGRMAGTWYLGHIAALVVAFVAGAGAALTPAAALLVATAAFVLAVATSWWHRDRAGPFERLVRYVAPAPRRTTV